MIRLLVLTVLSGLPVAVSAQENRAEAEASREVTNVLADADDLYGPPPPYEDCTEEQEAAIISGEIIVCRRKQDPREFQTMDRKNAQDRYARETAYANDPQAPDVAGDGIFRGPASVSGMCLIPPCPTEPALIIDIEALPEAPPGSDADRIARGLPPLGNDAAAPRAETEQTLPQRPNLMTGNQTNPAGSEAPEEEP